MAKPQRIEDGAVATEAEAPAALGAPNGRAQAGAFRALRHRNFRLFFVGQLISLIGTWMQTIAQQWLVYRLTGSAAMLGLISFVSVIPLIPLSLWGGSLADRLPRRATLVVTQTSMMILAFILAAMSWTGVVQVWHVMVLAVALAAVNAVDIPVRQAFIVDMVNGKGDLTSAIGLNSAIFNGARAIGPALAGVAVAATGEAGAFFMNGVSFLAVIAGLLMMRLPPHVRPAKPAPVHSHVVEGMRYVRGQRPIMVLISLVGVSAFLSMPYSTLLPVFAQDVLEKSGQPVVDFVCGPHSPVGLSCESPDALLYGLLMAAVGLGAVVGALFVASLGDRSRRGHWLTMGNLVFPALVLAMAFSRSLLLSEIVLLGVGFSFVTQNALANTLLQLHVPDELRGRVMSFYSLTFNVMMRFGGMQAGLMGDWLGAPIAVGIGGVISLAYGAFVAVRYPKVRRMA